MDRRQIIDALNRLAFAAEILDDTRVDPKALSGGAWNLRSVEGDLVQMHHDGDLAKLRNVNKAMKAMVASLIDTGAIPLLDELEAKVPEGLFAVRKVKGLGPKKVRALWHELDIKSLAELEQACSENRLVDLKGFGQKTQDKVLAGVQQVRAYAGRARLDVATALAERVRAHLESEVDGCVPTIVGDVRRGEEIANEISVLAIFTPEDEDDLEETIGGALLALGDDPDAPLDIILADEGEVSMVRATLDDMQVSVHLVESAAEIAVAKLTTTGPEPFVAKLSAHAEQRGLTLSSTRVSDASGGALSLATEDLVFEALGLWPQAPERRSATAPLVERSLPQPRLLRRQDLTGALHNHTVASDGGATLEQMRDAAIDIGLGWLGISEHSQSAVYAGGLVAGALKNQSAQVQALNADAKGSECPLLHGVESDILPDGSLDYDDTTLSGLSHVIASVHARGRLDRDGFTARMVRAAEHVWTDVIGHPTGRLLLGRPPSDYDTGAMLDACERCGTAVELNASPARLDLDEHLLAQAKERGILVSISADAHSTRALAHIDYGVTIARRAGLTPDDVLNARPFSAVKEWLGDRKEQALATLGAD